MFRKDQLPILLFNVIFLLFFGGLFAFRRDYEFLLYIGIIIIVILFVRATNYRAHYSNALSWALSLWGVMHMAGSGVYIKGVKLYELILVPISRDLNVLRYDQVVHALGMATATLAVYYILTSILKIESLKNWTVLSLLLVAIGLGIGAGNELVEFFVTLTVPRNGVGDYLNSSMDHVFNLIGIFIALVYIKTKEINNIKN